MFIAQKEWKQKLKDEFMVSESQEALARIYQTVRDGTLGIDYTIVNRDKNRQLRRDYNVSDEKIREILLDLKMTDFSKREMSNNTDHPDDIVYVFQKKHLLMPRYQEDRDYENVPLYIKITWPIENEMMLIISLHEENV